MRAPPFPPIACSWSGIDCRSLVTEKNTAGCRPTHSLACGRHVDGKTGATAATYGLYGVHPASRMYPEEPREMVI